MHAPEQYITGDSGIDSMTSMGGSKPHLMVQMDNHLGAVTRLRYKSSTRLIIWRTNWRGQPWLSILPIPVQVIEKSESIDQDFRGQNW